MHSTLSLNSVTTKLYGWGKYLNKVQSSQNSSTFTSINLHTPQLLNLLELKDIEYKSIASGFQHGLISFEKKEKNFSKQFGLFSFGLNTRGQLGLNRTSEEFDYGLIKDLPIGKISSIQCGREHSIVKIENENGESSVFATGSSNNGQLGMEGSKLRDNQRIVNYSMKFQKINLNDIKLITCGLDHTALVTKDNNIYTMGWGSDGQLGLGESPPKNKYLPTKIPYFNENKHNIIKISSCNDCTLALNDQGKVFSWGNSEYGQGGQGQIIDRILEPLSINFNEKIIDIASGGSFSLFLTENGQVFTVGFGVLGLGKDMTETLIPSEVIGLKRIQKIIAGPRTAAAINVNGEAYIWGMASPITSSLGLGEDNNHCFIPRILPLNYDKSYIQDIALGNYYNLLISKEQN
ncbi:RCC1/BLIP-II [Neoconidiobolus thromboides FSU 785]|nr:RCC1/BLIP-II [Neoconidiobolus thromboides FSU 785]